MGAYKRGRFYSYKFKWTVKSSDGAKENYVIRRPARVSNLRKAEEVEDEHKRVLRLRLIHPLDPWPQPPAPQSPTLRIFSDRFEKHAEPHVVTGFERFLDYQARKIVEPVPVTTERVQ